MLISGDTPLRIPLNDDDLLGTRNPVIADWNLSRHHLFACVPLLLLTYLPSGHHPSLFLGGPGTVAPSLSIATSDCTRMIDFGFAVIGQQRQTTHILELISITSRTTPRNGHPPLQGFATILAFGCPHWKSFRRKFDWIRWQTTTTNRRLLKKIQVTKRRYPFGNKSRKFSRIVLVNKALYSIYYISIICKTIEQFVFHSMPTPSPTIQNIIPMSHYWLFDPLVTTIFCNVRTNSLQCGGYAWRGFFRRSQIKWSFLVKYICKFMVHLCRTYLHVHG